MRGPAGEPVNKPVQEDVKVPDLFTDQPIPVEEKVATLRREVNMRESVYPRQVAAGKMRQVTADRQLAVMRAILDDYEQGRLSG